MCGRNQLYPPIKPLIYIFRLSAEFLSLERVGFLRPRAMIDHTSDLLRIPSADSGTKVSSSVFSRHDVLPVPSRIELLRLPQVVSASGGTEGF